MTYHKFQGDDWSVDEFEQRDVELANGEIVQIKLAERGTQLKNKLWVREIRKLSFGGHQTAIISTDYQTEQTGIAASMFARWGQENYFKYMRQHYNLDKTFRIFSRRYLRPYTGD